MNYPMIVPITELRRRFGEVTSNLANIEEILLTRGGEPFAVLTAAPKVKKAKLREFVGIWKGTELGDDAFWKKIMARKSRSQPVDL